MAKLVAGNFVIVNEKTKKRIGKAYKRRDWAIARAHHLTMVRGVYHAVYEVKEK